MNASFYIYDIDIEDWVRDLGPKISLIYNPTTSTIPARFNRNKNLLTMEQIKKRIEEGYVIVPVSKSIYAIDLLKYYNLGLKPCFMTSKAFKIFKKVYKDYI
jgi:hypothetical protein